MKKRYKVKFEFNDKIVIAKARDVSSYDAENLSLTIQHEDGTLEGLLVDFNDEIADEAIERLYDEKYGEELNFEVA